MGEGSTTGSQNQAHGRPVNNLEFRLEKQGAVWWVVFTGQFSHMNPRPAGLAEERLWVALQHAKQMLNELGAG